jgi:hypothetical protein
VFKRAIVREWLGWSVAARRFTDERKVTEFYSWMIGDKDEDGELGTPKLPEAKSVRDLGKIIDDANAMATFRSSDGTLTRALARFESEHPEDWLPNITAAESVLASLAPDTLRAMKEVEVASLKALQDRIKTVLSDREILLRGAAVA